MRSHRYRLCALGLALLAIAAVTPLLAQSGGNFEITRSTLDSGGARSRSGTFVVVGTIGQHDADPAQPSVGGSFAVTGGFWTPSTSEPVDDDIFLNGFEGGP